MAAVLGVALAQGSLWAEVFLMTSLIMEAMRGRRPTWYWGYPAFRDGLGQGAAYGTLFLGLVLAVDALFEWSWTERAFATLPSFSGAVLGVVTMPMVVTVLESLDDGRPFFLRLGENYRRWPLLVRGAVPGLALGFLPPAEIVSLPLGQRFLWGSLLGVVAAAGGSLVWDLGEVICGLRYRLRSWRMYAVAAGLYWSLAAPLFSVNFFLLQALVSRSWRPLRLLASREGLVLLGDSTIRVVRCGLWMAPIISSLVRISPDPTWYNQGGVVHTLVAIVQDWRLDPSAFRLWSRELFLSILACDWFRILIWFDSIGLQVATLVNLSFVGGDRLDEFLARFLGARVRSRCIPDAVRRFASWALLLIPWYLPAGAEWAYVWDGAQAIRSTGVEQIGILVAMLVFFLTGSGIMVFMARTPKSAASAIRTAGQCPAEDIVVHNGVYASIFVRDGRGYARVFRAACHGHEIDLTARPLSCTQEGGRIVYVRAGDALWSLGCRPTRHPSAVHTVVRLDDLSVRQTCSCQGIEARMDALVAEDAPGEVWIVYLTNVSDAPVHLEITSYRELTLNDLAAQARHPFSNRQHITTWCVVEERPSPRSAAIFANNRQLKAGDPPRPTRETYVHLVAGLEDESRLLGYEDSQLRFLGHGTLRRPHGLWAAPQPISHQSAHVTLDPIAAFRLEVDLAPGDATAFVLVDAYGPTPEAAMHLAARLAGIDPLPVRPKGRPAFLPITDVEQEMAAVQIWWKRLLADGVHIETSAPAVDRLVNVWLLYQILTARLWGQLGPQQRSGACAFRDQLQDVLPLCVGLPALARRQILLHASQQFHTGDVLSWWHPVSDEAVGWGMRSRDSESHLWLPYLVAHYGAITGDDSIWDEPVPFVEAQTMPSGAEGIVFAPVASCDRATVLEHCLRAVERTWRRRGRHGLPRMLVRDWNDGLSAVGVEGNGESVWLGFFLCSTLRQVAHAAASRGRVDVSRQLLRRMRSLAQALQTAWHGLAPHQQRVDISCGPGYESRGGWSWYTGAAARMLWGMYGILGLSWERGEPKVDARLAGLDVAEFAVRRITVRGGICVYEAPAVTLLADQGGGR